jgi:hypothetical protein
MKKLLLAAMLLLVLLEANAVCPAKLTGKFSGSGQYTEQTVINKVPVISYIEYHVVSVVFTSNTMSVTKEYLASTGSSQPASVEDTGSSTVTFDKNTCTGQIGEYSNPFYFAVSNSGNAIKIVNGKAPNSNYFYAEKWELNRQ